MNFRMNLGVDLILAVLIVTFRDVSCTLNYVRDGRSISDRIDNGGPLLLTSLMDRYPYDVVRNFSRVTHRDFGGVESYAGFFNVDAFSYNSFFWYFPAKENEKNAPVVLYLGGTPDKSTIFDVFGGIGPLKMKPNGELSPREDSWNNKHHMIYMESLITPGFSFSQSRRAIPLDLTISALGYILFSAIKQFFKLFPSLRSNEFYLAGNYYAGLVIPYLGLYLNDDQRKYPGHNLTINLKGIVVESGLVDPENQLVFGDYLYKSGLIDKLAKAQFLARERDIRALIHNERKGNVYDELEQLITGANSYFRRLTGRSHPYNLLKDVSGSTFDNDSSRIRRLYELLAPQLGYRTYGTYDPLRTERLHRVLTYRNRYFEFANLTEHYRVLLYTGNLDILCSYPSTQNWIKKYPWRGLGGLKYRKREKLRDASGELVGYMKKNINLTEVLLINVGHYPSVEKPKRTLELMEKFIGKRL